MRRTGTSHADLCEEDSGHVEYPPKVFQLIQEINNGDRRILLGGRSVD